MYLFTKKRRDGELVNDGDLFHVVFPYIMPGRNESAVYLRHTIDIDEMQDYIRMRRRGGERITMFQMLLTTLSHILYLRPKLNRFIAGRRLYQRNNFEVLFQVKLQMTDDAPASTAKLSFDGSENLDEVVRATNAEIAEIRKGEEASWEDKLIGMTAKMPRWFLRILAQIFRFMDFHGLMGKTMMEAIPLYSSCFLSHIGSIGGPAPYHHLYEFGTCSIFITLGRMYERPHKNRHGELEWRRCMDLCVTADERICDGFYFIRSIKMADEFFENPELLEISPVELAKLSDEERRNLARELKKDRQNKNREND